MKTIKYIFILVLLIISGTVIYFALKDGSYSITEKRTIKAPSDVIYNEIADFKNWQHWNPWLSNPDVTNTMGATTTGINGNYSFKDSYGTGAMTMNTLVPNKVVKMDLNYVYDMGTANAHVTMTLQPTESGTEVVWNINGNQSLSEKLMNFLFSRDLEKQIRPQYKKGLKNLEAYIKKQEEAYTIQILGIASRKTRDYLSILDVSIPSQFIENRTKTKNLIQSFIAENNLVTSGKPAIFYDITTVDTGSISYRTAIPVPVCPSPLINEYRITCYSVKASDEIVVILTGGYEHITQAWEKANDYIKEKNLTKSGLPGYEVYINDPAVVGNPSLYKTEIHIPVNQVIVYE